MQIMDTEQLLLARMRVMLTTTCGLTMRNIKECKVDSCLIQTGNKRAEEILDKIEHFTREDYVKALKVEADARKDPAKVAKQINDMCRASLYKIYDFLTPFQERCKGKSEAIFRAETLDDTKLGKTRLKRNHGLPITEAAPPEAAPEWIWHDVDTATEAVMTSQSLFITGVGGTGKSYIMRQLVRQLQEKGIHVKIIAKCHVATQNAGQGL